MPSAADIHAERIAARAAEAEADAPPMMSPRSRLASFQAEREKRDGQLYHPELGSIPATEEEDKRRMDKFMNSKPSEAAPVSENGGFRVALPGSGGGDMAPIPALGLSRMSSGGGGGGGSALSPRSSDQLNPSGPLSSRRLKKEVLKAESGTKGALDSSNTAGTITLRDEMGTPRSMRVVQREEYEDFNMVSVKWVCTEAVPFQVELRHGRKSGIRKIYVNKELIERTKSVANLVMDRGSTHNFKVGERPATITIQRGKSAGFTYSLSVDSEEIERDIGISATGLKGELGTHYVRPVVEADGFGMTLANCGQREDGVVVLELEPGFPAHRAGLLVGDIILSVGEECIVDTNVIIDKLANIEGEVILEVAGNSPSSLVMVPNPHAVKKGEYKGSLTLSDTACGVGVYVSAVEPDPSAPFGMGKLDVGDIILSVDGAVTESAKETMKYIARAPDPLTFVVCGRELGVVALS